MNGSERSSLEVERLRDLLRSVYSDSRTPADLRVKIGTGLGWLPVGAGVDDLPTPPVDEIARLRAENERLRSEIIGYETAEEDRWYGRAD